MTFRAPSLLTFSTANVFLSGPVVAQLDPQGRIAVTLPATDAGGMDPSDWSYVVTEQLVGVGSNRPPFNILLPAAQADVDLDDIAPSDPTKPNYLAVAGPPGPQGVQGPQGIQGPAGPSNTRWRRRDLPDPITADALYAGTAPVITTALGTTPTAGYVRHVPNPITLAGGEVRGAFTFVGAGGFLAGTVTPDTQYVLPTSRYPNTYASGQSVWAVEFGTDTRYLQVRFKHISAASHFRLSIDGRKVSDLAQPGGGTTAGSGHLITIDLGSAAPRVIRLDFTTMPFGGVYLPPSAWMWRVPTQGGRLGVLGDSISDGSAHNTGGGIGTWVHRAARLLGTTDVWEQGRGATGYCAPGTSANFGTRAPADIIGWGFDRLLIWGGYNDVGGFDQAVIRAAADALYAQIKTGLPACETTVIGCWAPTGTPAPSIVATDETLRAAAASAGLPFVSPVTGTIYNATGQAVVTHGQWITTGNASTYVGGDNVHPTDAGHLYISRRIVAALRELLPA
ncbi:SGNH/GDSL hydrolase family protein [Streptomyces sp. NPDC001584]|uniref:SGNH/GDSL hydrolase family protein n=1 Tax=unclassified Streptomyces TaxID=2593676 RepID=UPI003317DC4E